MTSCCFSLYNSRSFCKCSQLFTNLCIFLCIKRIPEFCRLTSKLFSPFVILWFSICSQARTIYWGTEVTASPETISSSPPTASFKPIPPMDLMSLCSCNESFLVFPVQSSIKYENRIFVDRGNGLPHDYILFTTYCLFQTHATASFGGLGIFA